MLVTRLRGRLVNSLRGCRCYASERGKNEGPSDPRMDIIKRALYPPTAPSHDPSPTGTHRSDVSNLLSVSIPSLEAHETITRAWALHQRNLRDTREEALRKKFESMKHAMEELEKVDKGLWLEATKRPNQRKMGAEQRAEMVGLKGTDRRASESRIEGMFPREMRLPTDTPSKTGWDHEWKAK